MFTVAAGGTLQLPALYYDISTGCNVITYTLTTTVAGIYAALIATFNSATAQITLTNDNGASGVN